MALKSVQRVTFSLPKTTVLKLEMRIPKNKRSKFIAKLIEARLAEEKETSLADIHAFWKELASRCPRKNRKTAVEMQREDRLSH